MFEREPAEVNSVIPASCAEGPIVCPWYTAVQLRLLVHHVVAVLTVEGEEFLYGCDSPSAWGGVGRGGGG